jgi:hypothetical protein
MDNGVEASPSQIIHELSIGEIAEDSDGVQTRRAGRFDTMDAGTTGVSDAAGGASAATTVVPSCPYSQAGTRVATRARITKTDERREARRVVIGGFCVDEAQDTTVLTSNCSET